MTLSRDRGNQSMRFVIGFQLIWPLLFKRDGMYHMGALLDTRTNQLALLLNPNLDKRRLVLHKCHLHISISISNLSFHINFNHLVDIHLPRLIKYFYWTYPASSFALFAIISVLFPIVMRISNRTTLIILMLPLVEVHNMQLATKSLPR